MLRKIAEIKVPAGAGPREVKTKNVFASYDRQGAAFAFFFSDSNIAGAAANLLFMVDGQKVFVDDGVTLGETNETHTFTYPLPDKLLNYTGKIDGYLYFDFEDGSHSDEIHFVFTIKKSKIDETMEDAPDVYIKSFEDIKADVQSTADKATSDIKSRVDAVENAKNSIVGDIEKAKDNAESQIGDYVGEVESAKDSTIEDIDKALPEVQAKIEEVSGKINELDISDTNLLTGTSDEWEEMTFSGWTTGYMEYTLEELDVKAGEVLTYQVEYDNTLDESSSALSALVSFYDEANGNLDSIRGSRIARGEKGVSFGSLKVPEGAVRLVAYKMYKSESGNLKIGAARKHKLQRGSYATDWTPNPSEIITKKDYDKLAEAIISLGGSV